MKETLIHLISNKTLKKEEAKRILLEISTGKFNNSLISSFLTVFMIRPITVEELEGFRDALLELCIKIDLKEYDTIDLCGTGGDNKDTFNISTAAAFVTAGCGIKVSKHGNYGVSSSCGSSNVLEFLGIKFSNDCNYLKKCLDESNICILHAPLFHPAMKHVAPVRKELGLKTFFNMLGPLVNPSKPKYQMVGVYSLELSRLYSYILRNSEKEFSIIHSLDGYDEISLTGKVNIIRNNSNEFLNPSDFSFNKVNAKSIEGGVSIKKSSEIFMNILKNKSTVTQKNVVIANSALAISTALNKTLDYGLEKAKESIESGAAYNSFKSLKKCSL